MGPAPGKTSALKKLASGVAFLAVVGVFFGPWLFERWYLWKLESSDGLERERIAEHFGVPALLKLLRNKEQPDYRTPAALALAAIDPDTAIPVLIDMLENEGYWGKSTAIVALSTLGPGAEDAVPALIELIRETSRQVLPQGETRVTLTQIHARVFEGGMEKLTPWMQNRILLTNAVGILANHIKPDGFEPAAVEAISVLSELLEEEDFIRLSAARLLRRVPGS